MSALRANLSGWLERARAGEEVLVTERGAPVARLVGVESSTLLEQLMRDGVLGKRSGAGRPQAAGRKRPPVKGSVSDLVSGQRR